MSNQPLELRLRLTPIVLLGILIALLVIPLAVFGHVAGAVFGMLIAALYLWFTVRTAQRRVRIDDDGISDTGILNARTIPWSDVEYYSFVSTSQQAAGAGVGGGGLIVVLVILIARAVRKKNPNRSFTTGALTVHARDGRKVSLTPQWGKDVDVALDRVFAELHPRLAAPRADRFAPIELTANAIVHPKKGELAWPEIERVDAANGQLRFRKRGKRLAWLAVGMARVRNSVLLLEQLAERGIVVKAAAEVFVPEPVMAKLVEANGRASSLPVAKLVQR